MASFGQTLRAARVGAELSQGDLAFLVGVESGTIAKYERDDTNPSRETFDLICAFLDTMAGVPFPGVREIKPPGNTSANQRGGSRRGNHHTRGAVRVTREYQRR